MKCISQLWMHKPSRLVNSAAEIDQPQRSPRKGVPGRIEPLVSQLLVNAQSASAPGHRSPRLAANGVESSESRCK